MAKRKTFVKFLLSAHSLIVATSLQAVELLTSDGAWNANGVITSSNGGAQTNSNIGGTFVGWGGVTFNSNNDSQHLDMQATESNPQWKYAAGYTYNYRSTSVSSVSDVNQVAYLTANGQKVAASRISGPNTSIPGNPNASNTISGSFVVAAGDDVVDQIIGMRLSSEGIQSRFRLNGNDVNALLTNHADFDGGNDVGALYSTYFSGNVQETPYDHVLDMSLTNSGGGISSNHFYINNSSSSRNTVSFGSETDTFRAGTIYKIKFDAKQHVANDPDQKSIDIVMGGGVYSKTITMSSTKATHTLSVDADAENLEGKEFSFEILASSLTSEGSNQYHIYDFSIEAMQQVPEPDSFAFWAASLTLTWIMTRRRFKATKAQV